MKKRASTKKVIKSKAKGKTLVYYFESDCFLDFLNFCNALPLERTGVFFSVLEFRADWANSQVVARNTFLIATSLSEKSLLKLANVIPDAKMMAETFQCIGSLESYRKNLT